MNFNKSSAILCLLSSNFSCGYMSDNNIAKLRLIFLWTTVQHITQYLDGSTRISGFLCILFFILFSSFFNICKRWLQTIRDSSKISAFFFFITFVFCFFVCLFLCFYDKKEKTYCWNHRSNLLRFKRMVPWKCSQSTVLSFQLAETRQKRQLAILVVFRLSFTLWVQITLR